MYHNWVNNYYKIHVLGAHWAHKVTCNSNTAQQNGWNPNMADTLTEIKWTDTIVFSPYAHVRRPTCWCPITYSGQLGKNTFAVAMGQHRQLTVQVLHITTQITTSSVYANLVQVALCVAHSDGESAFSRLTIVRCWTPTCRPCNGRIWTCTYGENTL